MTTDRTRARVALVELLGGWNRNVNVIRLADDFIEALTELRGEPGKIGHAFRSLNGDDRCAATVVQLPDRIECGHPASAHMSDYVRVTMGQFNGWIHECGNVDWLPPEQAPADGGCDRCESGSANASDWKPLYVGPS